MRKKAGQLICQTIAVSPPLQIKGPNTEILLRIDQGINSKVNLF